MPLVCASADDGRPELGNSRDEIDDQRGARFRALESGSEDAIAEPPTADRAEAVRTPRDCISWAIYSSLLRAIASAARSTAADRDCASSAARSMALREQLEKETPMAQAPPQRRVHARLLP